MFDEFQHKGISVIWLGRDRGELQGILSGHGRGQGSDAELVHDHGQDETLSLGFRILGHDVGVGPVIFNSAAGVLDSEREPFVAPHLAGVAEIGDPAAPAGCGSLPQARAEQQQQDTK